MLLTVEWRGKPVWVVHRTPEMLEMLGKPGRMTQAEYDAAVGDLVNYLVWMGEPAQNTRHLIGFYVLLFLGLFLPFVYYLKKAYWKDIH
jgi:ubiquinol-cytochrome c reductase cytochrome c1 subunit